MKTTTKKVHEACLRLEKRVPEFVRDDAIVSAMEMYTEYLMSMPSAKANHEAMCVRYRVLRKEVRSELRWERNMDKFLTTPAEPSVW